MNTPSASPSPDQIDERLTELEIKASFAEDWLEQLNQTIYRQQAQIEALMREISQLRQQIPEGSAVTHLRDELPPHY
jgi:SlyX protein